jgi:hypothetical protein
MEMGDSYTLLAIISTEKQRDVPHLTRHVPAYSGQGSKITGDRPKICYHPSNFEALGAL